MNSCPQQWTGPLIDAYAHVGNPRYGSLASARRYFDRLGIEQAVLALGPGMPDFASLVQLRREPGTRAAERRHRRRPVRPSRYRRAVHEVCVEGGTRRCLASKGHLGLQGLAPAGGEPLRPQRVVAPGQGRQANRRRRARQHAQSQYIYGRHDGYGLSEEHLSSRAHWRRELTAAMINNWIRKDFGR